MFQLQKSYTRQQIHDLVRGSLESYLPHVGGQVVCACLRTDTNPDAPNIVLPGTGKDIEHAAEMLASQREPVPTFLRESPNRWDYVGMFRVDHVSRDPAEIRKHAERSGRDDITMVIHMAAGGM
jgi:hypothetical protein